MKKLLIASLLVSSTWQVARADDRDERIRQSLGFNWVEWQLIQVVAGVANGVYYVKESVSWPFVKRTATRQAEAFLKRVGVGPGEMPYVYLKEGETLRYEIQYDESVIYGGRMPDNEVTVVAEQEGWVEIPNYYALSTVIIDDVPLVGAELGEVLYYTVEKDYRTKGLVLSAVRRYLGRD